MGNSEEKRIAGGFLFLTEKEAKLAEVERKKIHIWNPRSIIPNRMISCIFMTRQ